MGKSHLSNPHDAPEGPEQHYYYEILYIDNQVRGYHSLPHKKNSWLVSLVANATES